MFFLVPVINLKILETSYVTENLWQAGDLTLLASASSKQSSPEDQAMTSKETTGAMTSGL